MRTVGGKLQPINFVTLTRVTNNASSNWVNLVQVSSVQFDAMNTAQLSRVFEFVLPMASYFELNEHNVT